MDESDNINEVESISFILSMLFTLLDTSSTSLSHVVSTIDTPIVVSSTLSMSTGSVMITYNKLAGRLGDESQTVMLKIGRNVMLHKI